MTPIWKLLKDYVREFEIANNAEFGEEAWQRIKRLHEDILKAVHDMNDADAPSAEAEVVE